MSLTNADDRLHRSPRASSPDGRAHAAARAALIAGLVGLYGIVGADSRWLAALGRYVVLRGAVPRGVPFAGSPTTHWANTLVLAELIFHWLEAAFGDRGLVLAQTLAVGLALYSLARDAGGGNDEARGVGIALAITVLGSISSLAIARVQMFSLVLFPVLAALLRAEHRDPSQRIWLSLPLLALWSNLHGAVISGLVVLYGYLLLDRIRHDPRTTIAMALLAPAAICVTPAFLRSLDYYHGLVTNVAVQRGEGQWAPLGTGPLDLLLIGAVIVLALPLARRTPPLWESAVLLVFAILTVKASRDGVWLLFFLVVPCAKAGGPLPIMRDRGLRARAVRWLPMTASVAVFGSVLLVYDVFIRPTPRSGASLSMVAAAIRVANGTPILADSQAGEQIALAGGRIWAGNPLDAFSRKVQAEYLNWTGGAAAGGAILRNSRVRVVLVAPGGGADRLTIADQSFRRIASGPTSVLYERVR